MTDRSVDLATMSKEAIEFHRAAVGPVLEITPQGYDEQHADKAILFFFGGAFVVGSPHADLPISARLASRLGVKTFSPYYRLAPEHPCPAAIDDGIAVYQSLLQRVVPENIAFAGESAGGIRCSSARLHVWEGMWHSFEWYADIPEAEESLDEIANFLGSQFG